MSEKQKYKLTKAEPIKSRAIMPFILRTPIGEVILDGKNAIGKTGEDGEVTLTLPVLWADDNVKEYLRSQGMEIEDGNDEELYEEGVINDAAEKQAQNGSTP